MTRDGAVPFSDWLNSIQDLKTVNIIQKRLAYLRLGNLGDYKAVEGFFELRIDYGPGYRIYIGKKGKAYVLLLIGGSKQTQRKDIERASEYWQEYKGRTSR